MDSLSTARGVSEDTVAALMMPRVRFARARPEALEISSMKRVSLNDKNSYDTSMKPIIRVDNVYRTSIHLITEYKRNTKMINVDPKNAIINHYRIPSLWREYEKYDFNDPHANVTDATLQKEIPLLEAAIATRYNMEVSSVQGFLKKLATRRPPNITTAAAQHKMW